MGAVDGGEAGLHPSNIHDTGYAIGAVDLTGDTPVILGPDGPSLGGFVCPAVVAAAERWKLGQLAPGDRVRLVPWSSEAAARGRRDGAEWLARAHATRSSRSPVRRGTARSMRDGDRRRRGARPRRSRRRIIPASRTARPATGSSSSSTAPMTLDLELRARVHALEQWVGGQPRAASSTSTAGVRSLLVQVDGDAATVRSALERAPHAPKDELGDLGDVPFPSRIVHLPLSWDDPATREAIARYMHGVRADAPWCPWNIEFIRRINGLASRRRRPATSSSPRRYLVLGLGDVYLGAPVATPLDPRHRLVTTKYNPARTWTPENAVGIGGAYLCIYGMEGPGGYQFVGRTVQVWNRDRRGPHFDQPWLLRNFDQIRFHPGRAPRSCSSSARPTPRASCRSDRADARSAWPSIAASWREHADEIDAFKARQQAAFDEEQEAWAAAGEFA